MGRDAAAGDDLSTFPEPDQPFIFVENPRCLEKFQVPSTGLQVSLNSIQREDPHMLSYSSA